MSLLAIKREGSLSSFPIQARGLTILELEELFSYMGEKKFRTRQVTTWLYKKGVSSFHEMTDLSQDLRERLAEYLDLKVPAVIKVEKSVDGSRKFLLKFKDGEQIESVLIPDGERLTLCISTQAGCAMGCRFCMTGKTGLNRNLFAHEMVDQFFAARTLLTSQERITNLVLMGMGEPLANLKEVKRFLAVATDRECMDFSPRRVTLSTVGIPEKMEMLGREFREVSLAVSLNATTDDKRSFLMPVNRRFNLKTLLKACKDYPLPKRKRITIEYVLIKGVNDSLEDAGRLNKLLKGIPCKINLIPFNPFPGVRFERPSEDTILAFKSSLMASGYTAIVRTSKGSDILAACGQLRGLKPTNC